MITISHKGDFRKTIKFFDAITKASLRHVLDKYGRRGVEALSAATPVDTGKTAASWVYSITWSNTNVNNHVNIALILQYGHATRNGGYVRGRDYIKPAIQPIFDQISREAWREVDQL